ERLEPHDPPALSLDARFGGLVGLHELGGEIPERSAEAEQQVARVGGLRIESHAHAEAELGVVLEERIRPRWTSTVTVERPGCRRLASAVDRRASGRVRHEGPVTEELAQELEIGRLAAAGAGARELEERLEELAVLHLTRVEQVPVGLGQAEEEDPVPRFRLAKRWLRRHVDGSVADLALALGRADLDAQRAAGAILGGDLERIPGFTELGPARRRRLERGGRLGQESRCVDLGPDDRMGTHEHALAALD